MQCQKRVKKVGLGSHVVLGIDILLVMFTEKESCYKWWRIKHWNSRDSEEKTSFKEQNCCWQWSKEKTSETSKQKAIAKETSQSEILIANVFLWKLDKIEERKTLRKNPPSIARLVQDW